jgi:hypothetical protein
MGASRIPECARERDAQIDDQRSRGCREETTADRAEVKRGRRGCFSNGGSAAHRHVGHSANGGRGGILDDRAGSRHE